MGVTARLRAEGSIMRELTIHKNDAGQRLDKFLTKALSALPPALLYKSLRKKKIKVNRHRAEGGQILSEGDTVQLFLADEFFPDGTGSESASLARIKPNLSIVYEDEHILLLNKREGVLVHEDDDGNTDTLIRHVQAYLYQKGEYDPEGEQSFAPALCNRIDRNTSGIVIAAKTAEALRVMADKIREREIEKKYLCAVHGIPNPREATLCAYLVKNEREKMVRVYDRRVSGAKEICTRYRTLATRGDTALLEVELLTGRTHQIRAHMAHIGHPLLGDGKYGVNRGDRARGYQHQALCSYSLCFAFKTDAGALSYLTGKKFSIPKDQVYFTKEFFGKEEV